MKTIAYVVGALLIIAAIAYFVMPADQLPSFFPGAEQGLNRPRIKHGIVSAVVGVVLIAIGWWMGRSKSA